MNYQNYNPYQYWQNPMSQNVYNPQMNPIMPNQMTYGSNLNGKFVQDFDSITANDVPMSGTAIFPMNDLSKIELRKWNANGTIDRILYSPTKVNPEIKTAGDNVMEEIKVRLDNIEKLLTPVKKGKAYESKSNSEYGNE